MHVIAMNKHADCERVRGICERAWGGGGIQLYLTSKVKGQRFKKMVFGLELETVLPILTHPQAVWDW